MLAGAVAVAVVVIAVALVHGRSPERPAASPAVVYRGFASDFYAASGSLYAITSDQPEVSPLVGEPPHLVRVDPSAGGVVARQTLAPPPTSQGQPVPAPGHLLVAAGSLWVTANDGQKAWLWRLDPCSLAVRSLTVLPGGGTGQYWGSLADAGDWLWVVNRNTLVHVSLTTGRVAGSRTVGRALLGQGNAIATDASGRALVVAITGPTDWHVELLKPGSGAALASSTVFSGSVRDLVGVLDGGAWINPWAGGAVRIDLRTLKVTAEVGRFPLAAQTFGGIVAVGAVGHAATRCVDPVAGRTLAPLPDVVAVEGSTAYVQVQRRGIPEIRRHALDPRCLAGS